MWLPATFSTYAASVAEKDQGSFKAQSRAWAPRIDHIALSSSSFTVRPGSVRVLHDFECSNASDDHVPCMLQLTCTSDQSHAPFRIRRPRYNRTLLLSEFASDYADKLDATQLSVFELEPTPHQFQMAGMMQNPLIHVCGSPVQPPRRKQIEKETVATVLVTGTIRGTMKWVRKHIVDKPISTAFLAWNRSHEVGLFNHRTQCICSSMRCGSTGTSTVSWYAVWVCCSRYGTVCRVPCCVHRNIRDSDTAVHTQFVEALKSKKPSEMHAACSVVKAKRKARSKRVRDKNGITAINDRAERLISRGHFPHALKGEDTTLEDIINRERLEYQSSVNGTSLDAAAIPSLVDTTRLIASSARQSAVGGDRLGFEAFSAAPKAVARHVHPLLRFCCGPRYNGLEASYMKSGRGVARWMTSTASEK